MYIVMLKYSWVMPLLLIAIFIKVNFSSSMPIGIYIKQYSTKLNRGDSVAVCLPKELAQKGLARQYLIAGFCPGFSMPVLKLLIGLPGDNIQITKKFIIVNERFYYAPQKTFDNNGQVIPSIYFEKNQQSTKYFWLYGEFNAIDSWDSRYYGGVSQKNMIGVYRPLWVKRMAN